MITLRRITAFLTIFSLFANQTLAATWYVDSAADDNPGTCVAGDLVNDGNCTFRDALAQAVDGDVITFLFDNYVLNPAAGYVVATNNLTIDGNADNATVTFDGDLSGGADAFTVTGAGVTLKNLYIAGGFGSGVVIDGASDAAIVDNVNIGVKGDFTKAGVIGNGFEASGTNWTLENSDVVESGGHGVAVTSGSGFTISNVSVGTDVAGFDGFGNVGDGINISGNVSGVNNILGSRIMDNGGQGIEFAANGVMNGTFNIRGNTIGDVNNMNVGNLSHGIYAAQNIDNTAVFNLGGNGFDDMNVISNNGGHGVFLESCDALVAKKNVIGSDGMGGLSAFGNGGDGLRVNCKDVQIGTDLDAVGDGDEWNHFANNDGYGIHVVGNDVTGVVIHGNLIGSDSQGGQGFDNLGNLLGGIEVNAPFLTSLVIGANNANARNKIIENGGGIRVTNTAVDATITIKNNAIGVEDMTFPWQDPAIVGNNALGGYNKGILIDLDNGTADLNIGATSTAALQSNDVIGHASNGIEIGSGVKTVNIKGNNIGVAYDLNADSYIRDGGNDGAGIYVNSIDGLMTSLQIGEIGSPTYENRIGGNGVNGVHVEAVGAGADVTVANNVFGLGQNGTTVIGNTGVGILIEDGNNVAINNNRVSNSTSHGVRFTAGTLVTMLNNVIGSADDNNATGNGGDGVRVDGGNVTIGGVGLNEGNVISENGGYGIYVSAGVVSVFGNLIGFAADGVTLLANTLNSLRAVSTAGSIVSLIIGGDEEGEANTINNTDAVGIYLADVKPVNDLKVAFNDHNVWSDDDAEPVNNYWEYYVASVLTNYGPGGEISGGFWDISVYFNNDNDEEDVEDEEVLILEDKEGLDKDKKPVEKVPELEVPYQEQVVAEKFELNFSDDDEVLEVEKVEKVEKVEEEVAPREVVRRPLFRDQALRPNVNRVVALEGVAKDIADFEDGVDPNAELNKKVDKFLDDVVSEDGNVEVKKKFENSLKNIVSKKIDKMLLDGVEDVFLPSVGGGKKKVDKNTKLIFEPNFEEAKRLQLRANERSENAFVLTTFTDINDNGVSDMLEAVLKFEDDREDDGRFMADKIFFRNFDLYGGKVKALAGAIAPHGLEDDLAGAIAPHGLEDDLDGAIAPHGLEDDLAGAIAPHGLEDDLAGAIAPHGLEITNVPGYGATVGGEMLFWVAGPKAGEGYELSIVNRDTLEEVVVERGQLDVGNKAAVLVEFPEEGDYYVVVKKPFGGRHIVRVMVDFDLEEGVNDLDLLGDYEPRPMASEFVFARSMQANVLLAVGFESEEREVRANDDRVLSGYADPGAMVFVTWQSVVMNSVVIADAGQGYFEVKVPEELEEGEHRVTVYNYNRKNQRFSSVLTQLFRR